MAKGTVSTQPCGQIWFMSIPLHPKNFTFSTPVVKVPKTRIGIKERSLHKLRSVERYVSHVLCFETVQFLNTSMLNRFIPFFFSLCGESRKGFIGKQDCAFSGFTIQDLVKNNVTWGF